MANLSIEGLNPDQVFTKLVDKGVTESEAVRFIGDWLSFTVGGLKRVFNYTEPFPESDPACAPNFARTFAHQDWVDGESVVQAQQTAGEDGFNVRFHNIEHDIDQLGANVAKLFTCVAEMRKSMFALLGEIRSAINQINQDIGAKTTSPGVGTGILTQQATQFLGSSNFGNQAVTMWQTPQGVLVLPSVQTINVDPAHDPRATRPGQLLRFIAEHPEVPQTFGGSFTKEDFVRKFGDTKTADGTQVSDILRIIPDGFTFNSVTALTQEVSSREASALRTTPGAIESVGTALGVAPEAGAAGNASIVNFTAVPPEARAALVKSGVDTIQKLGDAKPDEVATILQNSGVKGLNTGDIAEFIGRASTLRHL
jgi:hypothetical protein